MSRGPGRIEREIWAAIVAEPARVFTIEQLGFVVYPQRVNLAKKHRVSLIRAVKHVIQHEPDWHIARAHSSGRPFVVFNGRFAAENEIPQLTSSRE